MTTTALTTTGDGTEVVDGAGVVDGADVDVDGT